jgi:hypothetical protein
MKFSGTTFKVKDGKIVEEIGAAAAYRSHRSLIFGKYSA